MITIAFSNQKGGVAKTTSALNVAAYIARSGRRVLAIDLDPQGNFAFSLGVNQGVNPFELVDVFEQTAETYDALRKAGKIDLLSIGLRGTAADLTYTAEGREYLLKNVLDEIAENYDYCIIDTAPSLNILTINALTAADYVIIPLTVDAYALQGIMQLSGFIKNIQEYTNKNLKIMGVVRTSYDKRLQSTKVLKSVVEMSLATLHCEILADIRQSADIVKAQITRQNIFDFSESSRAAEDYTVLAKRVMRIAEGSGK